MKKKKRRALIRQQVQQYKTALEAAEQRIYDQYERQATMTYGDRLMELYENAPLPSDYFENNY